MSRRLKLFVAAGIAVSALAAGGAYAFMLQDASASLRAQVDAINIKRRAFYTDLAAKRGAKIEEVAATTACEIFASKVQAGQYYRLSDGVWRQRDAGQPVQRPAYCG